MMKNVFAVSAHGRPECVEDLILNLQRFDPTSHIVLYDGGGEGAILAESNRWRKMSVDVVPNPIPQVWGSLHDFAIGSIDHISDRQYDTITFVDSDQLLITQGYSEYLSRYISSSFGVLSILPKRHGADSPVMCVRDLHADRQNWMPYLRQFSNWEEAFVRWTFWPGTVLSADAARAVAHEFKMDRLTSTLRRSRAWATEECIIPTVSALLGFREILNPCDRSWCKFRTPWSITDVEEATSTPGAFFMHPVLRYLSDPVRAYIRENLK